MAVLADRFVRDAAGRGVDLATGHGVRLRIMRASRPAVQQSRRLRCDALSSLWHPHLLTLIDHGLLGQDRWFEAWAVPSADVRAGTRRTVGAVRAAVSFLHASGLSAGRASLNRVAQFNSQVVLVPDASTGHALDTDRAVDAEARAWRRVLHGWPDPPREGPRGLRLPAPPVLKWVADVLDDARPGEVRSLSVCGRGWPIFRLMVARMARVRGFVPVDVALLKRCTALSGMLQERHLMLLADDDPGGAWVGGLLSARLRNPNACVVLRRVRRPGGIDTALTDERVLSLDGLPAERVADMASAYLTDPSNRLPQTRPSIVREAQVFYASEAAAPANRTRGASADMSPIVPDASRARHDAKRAHILESCGRHAAAERSYRRAIGALERRRLAAEAAACRLALAEHLARRGRTDEAVELLTACQPHDDHRINVRTAVSIATFRTDQARLVEAESSARWAGLAAQESGDRLLGAASARALARCLFWQDRIDEAASCLPEATADDRTHDIRVRAERTRIALARGDVGSAVRAAAAAGRAACGPGEPAAEVAGYLSMAAVQAAIGDAPGFRQHIQKAGDVARKGRAPLERLRVLLALAQGAVALGLRDELAGIDRSLQRWGRRSLPALLRIRVQHARGRLGQRDCAAAARRAAEAYRIGMLLRPCEPGVRKMDAFQEIADILQICHESPDERTALTRTCVAVRDRLKARSVGIVGPDGGAISGAGPGCGDRSVIVDRVVATGQAVGPTLENGGLEAATPVRYAGRTIAVLSGRWTVDSRLSETSVLSVLSAAAAASAPSARALLDRLAMSGPQSPAAVPALLGSSHAIELIRQAAIRAARAPFSVLVEGESGSGKELVARAIHMYSERRDRRFCTINCAALSDELLEAELFGHARGAFTGAVAERAGLFEDADHGTLLLDELSELSPRAQAKLLRVLQDGEVRRVGENLPRRVDVRIIGASNRSLAQEVATGRFRADLRYRLDVIRIVVPPLRDRVEDIPLLAAHFWDQATRRTHSRATLDPETLAALACYDWPGNVRELQNAMTALAVQAGPRGRIGPAALPDHVARGGGVAETATLEKARESFERKFVRATLARVGGHRGRAARALGVTRQGLAKLLKRLDIERPGAAMGESARAVP